MRFFILVFLSTIFSASVFASSSTEVCGYFLGTQKSVRICSEDVSTTNDGTIIIKSPTYTSYWEDTGRYDWRLIPTRRQAKVVCKAFRANLVSFALERVYANPHENAGVDPISGQASVGPATSPGKALDQVICKP